MCYQCNYTEMFLLFYSTNRQYDISSSLDSCFTWCVFTVLVSFVMQLWMRPCLERQAGIRRKQQPNRKWKQREKKVSKEKEQKDSNEERENQKHCSPCESSWTSSSLSHAVRSVSHATQTYLGFRGTKCALRWTTCPKDASPTAVFPVKERKRGPYSASSVAFFTRMHVLHTTCHSLEHDCTCTHDAQTVRESRVAAGTGWDTPLSTSLMEQLENYL